VTAPVTLVWLRRDLRLTDNPALHAAVAGGGPVVPVFIWGDEPGPWSTGAAARWRLYHSLRALDADLRRRGSRLVVVRRPAVAALAELARRCDARHLHCSRTLDPGEPSATQLAKALAAAGAPIGVTVHDAGLLFGPPFPTTAEGRPYHVFTPFWRACRAAGAPPRPQPAPARLAPCSSRPDGMTLDEVRAEAVAPWSAGFSDSRPGETGALERLSDFVAGALARYAEDRDRPGLAGTSLLSPHLHFGEISARTVWHAVADTPSGESGGPEAFLRQLAWREFAHHLLLEHPRTTSEPLRPAFARFPWNDDPAALAAWQEGRTGYPLVDAGMRQLWQTGWMHNRVRLVCASVLCKHLLVPWQHGARWFWETLLDADLADNTLGWQWVAGSGADAAPYFRIFNPVSQGRRYDPDGTHVRRWLPELAALPDAVIHAPWEAPASVRLSAGIRLVEPGEAAALAAGRPGPQPLDDGCYPEPFIDHALARRRALDAYATMKERAGA